MGGREGGREGEGALDPAASSRARVTRLRKRRRAPLRVATVERGSLLVCVCATLRVATVGSHRAGRTSGNGDEPRCASAAGTRSGVREHASPKHMAILTPPPFFPFSLPPSLRPPPNLIHLSHPPFPLLRLRHPPRATPRVRKDTHTRARALGVKI